ncbi:hypothetical protein THRCLA_10117 [Thraustotheca clavata]|uniref:Uncharacterized protein n=1 Tax=Thraustotheca clavata TaxID=74557 RepID=A0A1V9YSN4_9STRA|nr:hypothetical protein THRCLA_10117 [Thraustotheca clavata]
MNESQSNRRHVLSKDIFRALIRLESRVEWGMTEAQMAQSLELPPDYVRGPVESATKFNGPGPGHYDPIIPEPASRTPMLTSKSTRTLQFLPTPSQQDLLNQEPQEKKRVYTAPAKQDKNPPRTISSRKRCTRKPEVNQLILSPTLPTISKSFSFPVAARPSNASFATAEHVSAATYNPQPTWKLNEMESSRMIFGFQSSLPREPQWMSDPERKPAEEIYRNRIKAHNTSKKSIVENDIQRIIPDERKQSISGLISKGNSKVESSFDPFEWIKKKPDANYKMNLISAHLQAVMDPQSNNQYQRPDYFRRGSIDSALANENTAEDHRAPITCHFPNGMSLTYRMNLFRSIRDLKQIMVHESVKLITGRRASTYFLLEHLRHLKGINIPNTALFDDEGVIVQWLFTSQTFEVMRKKKIQNTNLLLFELKLQEEAENKQVTHLAVLWEDNLVLYNESDLDTLIRTLCARETEMLTPIAQLLGSRKYGNGSFCLQEYVPPGDGLRYLTHLTTSGLTRISKITSAIQVISMPFKSSLESDHFQSLSVPREIESIFQQAATLVFTHLQLELDVEELVLEWVYSPSESKKMIFVPYLLGAQYIRYSSRNKPDKKPDPIEASKELNHYTEEKVCRYCRQPREVELNRELIKTQAILRQMISKLQTTEKELEQSHSQIKTMQQKNQDLDVTVNELHNQLKREGSNAKYVIQQLQEQCVESESRLHTTQMSLESEEDTRLNLENMLDEMKIKMEHLKQSADTNQNALKLELKRLQQDGDVHLRKIASLKDDLAAMTKERDDCLSFRGYLYRRLADTTQPGVEPPLRRAGGFWSYPTPSPQNVAEVVRVLVDSQRNSKAKKNST